MITRARERKDGAWMLNGVRIWITNGIATDIAREARRLLGANGILAEYLAMRHFANPESVCAYEGTQDAHSRIVGQSIT